MPESVGRMELWAQLGRITVAESMLDNAAAYVSEQEWRRTSNGRATTSIYASRFPGGSRPCERQLLYGLMNFPSSEQMPQMVSATAIVGKAVEDWETDLLEYDGRLLSTPASADDQLVVLDSDHWLSGRVDIVTLPPFWNRPLLIEKKTKDSDVVEEMRSLKRSYDPGHGFQARAYIAMLRELSPVLWPSAVVCRHTWRIALPGGEDVIDAMVCRDHGIHADSGCLIEIPLEPLQEGVLSYSGRNRPNLRSSWYFQHDEAWWQRGLEVLKRVKQNFTDDKLPPHPFGGKQWSAQPCQWCNFKRESCKPDHLAGVTKLSESHGAEWARQVYGGFDPEAVRQAIMDRWAAEKPGISHKIPEGYEIGRNGVQRGVTHV